MFELLYEFMLNYQGPLMLMNISHEMIIRDPLEMGKVIWIHPHSDCLFVHHLGALIASVRQ